MRAEDPEGVERGSVVPGWGSGPLAGMLGRLALPYLALVPGSSYRGLHDSLVNYNGNHDPQLLVCLHEEHAVAPAGTAAAGPAAAARDRPGPGAARARARPGRGPGHAGPARPGPPAAVPARPARRGEPDWDRRVALAERSGARVISDLKNGAVFPTGHRLYPASPGIFLPPAAAELSAPEQGTGHPPVRPRHLLPGRRRGRPAGRPARPGSGPEKRWHDL